MEKILDVLAAISLLFLAFLLVSKFKAGKTNSDRLIWLVLFSFVILLFTFRDLGLDLENYRAFYDGSVIQSSINNSTFEFDFEIGWLTVIFFFKKIGLSFHFFLFFSSAIPIYIIYYIAKKNDKEIKTPVVFIFFMAFLFWDAIDIIRAFFASALILLSIYQISENKKIRAATLMLPSVAFHNSAILSPLAFILSKFRVSPSFAYFGLALSAFLGIIVYLSLSFISIGSGYDHRDGSFFQELIFKINYYLVYYQQHGYKFINATHFFLSEARTLLNYLCYTFIFFFSVKLQHDSNRFVELQSRIFIFTAFIYTFFVFSGLSVLGIRILMLLNLGCLFIMARAFSDSWLKKKWMVAFSLLLFLRFVVYLLYLAGLHQPKSPFFLGL
ncbi:EpsG family protein [Gallaecimonas pentaromativorans]|uniref:EpsG-like putative glucosyltransferase n=1 Tax=Gallaecimonas pentaromativorans TaxID=584787 RepID=A0A3N1NRV8_9GAMM|nr:EpsG family protein [Gallaecimonas pentaromativorans]ROQ22534.1 EpsG-like putative glucosyltransferase [Gallaecimonas pentaromativorans]